MVEQLPSMCGALGSNSNSERKKNTEDAFEGIWSLISTWLKVRETDSRRIPTGVYPGIWMFVLQLRDYKRKKSEGRRRIINSPL